MEKKRNQDKLLYAIVAALAVMLVGYLVFVNKPAPAPAPAPQPDALAPSAEPTSTTAPSAATAPATGAKPLTYEQAVTQYGGYRFQFVSCHGSPGTMTVTSGKKFMLDNRDAKAHTIMVGKVAYKVGGNGFAIATAASAVGTYNITCDGGGAATLKVQK